MASSIKRPTASVKANIETILIEKPANFITMKAPIKGVVGSIDFVQHGPATAYSGITIVGTGASEITVQVPLALMTKVEVGQVADVIPPGSTQTVPGEVKAISPLPSKLSTGTSYDAVISVPKSPRIVPLAALRESVGPSRSRTLATIPSPCSAMTITGRELMNSSISG